MSTPAPAVTIVTLGDTEIEVLAQSQGHPIVLLPSLGRGAADFDAIAERLAAASFRVLRPQPRGIGASRGAMTGIDLHTYAADIAAVIEHDGSGYAFVIGHAFGNRVARMLAVDRPPCPAARRCRRSNAQCRCRRNPGTGSAAHQRGHRLA